MDLLLVFRPVNLIYISIDFSSSLLRTGDGFDTSTQLLDGSRNKTSDEMSSIDLQISAIFPLDCVTSAPQPRRHTGLVRLYLMDCVVIGLDNSVNHQSHSKRTR